MEISKFIWCKFYTTWVMSCMDVFTSKLIILKKFAMVSYIVGIPYVVKQYIDIAFCLIILHVTLHTQLGRVNTMTQIGFLTWLTWTHFLKYSSRSVLRVRQEDSMVVVIFRRYWFLKEEKLYIKILENI